MFLSRTPIEFKEHTSAYDISNSWGVWLGLADAPETKEEKKERKRKLKEKRERRRKRREKQRKSPNRNVEPDIIDHGHDSHHSDIDESHHSDIPIPVNVESRRQNVPRVQSQTVTI